MSRGSKCNDGGGTPCYNGGDGIPCTHPSCGFITITTSNYTTSSTTCRIYDTRSGHWATKTVNTNGSDQTTAYYGYPNDSIWVECAGGANSAHYGWPNS